MGRRRERRASVRLLVRVRGIDRDGNPFVQDAYTLDISRTGARLEEIRCLKGPGETVALEHGKHKARFSVLWVDDQLGQIGVRCLEPTKWSWGVPLPPSAPDEYQPAPQQPAPAGASSVELLPPEAPWTGQERRQHTRYRCRGTADLCPDGGDVWVSGTIVDLSVGGCYVETLSPLPVGVSADLVLTLGELQLSSRAVVRTCHPSAGMGIAFTETNDEDRQRLLSFIERLASQAVRGDMEPDLETAAVFEAHSWQESSASLSEHDSRTLLHALLELLQKKGVVAWDEVEEAMRRRRE